jgi:hypothetical protein
MSKTLTAKAAPAAANQNSTLQRPSEEEAKEAVRTLIRWAGDDPAREGLLDTPHRVVYAYREFYEGYDEDPDEILSRTFEEVEDRRSPPRRQTRNVNAAHDTKVLERRSGEALGSDVPLGLHADGGRLEVEAKARVHRGTAAVVT